MKSLIFIENKEQAKIALKLLAKNHEEQFTIIALNPETCFFLDQRKKLYDMLETNVNDILTPRLDSEYIEKTKKIIYMLDEIIISKIPSIKIRPFNSNLVSFIPRFGCVLNKIRLFDIFLGNSRKDIKSVYYFSGSKKLDMLIIPLVCKKYSINFYSITEPVLKKDESLIKKIIAKLKKLESLRKLQIELMFYKFSTFFAVNQKKPQILATNFNYDVKFVIKELLNKKIPLLLWRSMQIDDPFYLPHTFKKIRLTKTQDLTVNITSQIAITWKAIAEDLSEKSEFEYLNINLFSILNEEFENYALTVLPLLNATYLRTLELIQKCKLKLLLSAGAYSEQDRAIFAAFREKKIPIIVYQHGPTA